jgi:hypothetical protein
MTDLPPGWEWARLDEVADIQGGIQKQAKRRPILNKYPFLRVANVTRGHLDLSEVHEVELFEGELERYRLKGLFAVSRGLLRVRWGQVMDAGLGLVRVGSWSLAAVR